MDSLIIASARACRRQRTPVWRSRPWGFTRRRCSRPAAASGGQAPYTFSTTLASGALPAGLSLSTSGAITGTPTAVGVFTFTVTGTDSSTATPANFTSAPISLTINAAVPGAPTIGTATAGNGQASVSFTPPPSNGGAAITSYTVTSTPGGFTGTGGASPITVTGLTNGIAYTFKVTATNSAGAGAASAASNSVTPQFDPKAIPTLSEWGLIILASMMAMFGIAYTRRRQR